ncbi:hypothetical protein B9Z55_021859 [Caenorhabditis nigoni]|uniref:Uncharacterized protein n=1 Tax=Caenorhabditis nigoni TaxID=1611254 RepID=A0A2G5TTZ7_9PELO|nr:hypothetical protein B9Z55_021859 [Caenorhabditis nigoni]
MAAVISEALQHAPKTRVPRTVYQAAKSAAQHALKISPTTKRSNNEAGLDLKSNYRLTTNPTQQQPEEPRVGSPQDEQIYDASESRKRYLGEKAATIEMPTAEMAQLVPRFLFDDATLIINMCLPCRIASRKHEMQDVDGDNQNLVVNLCKICRSTLKAQLSAKFFKHQLPCFKRLQLKESAKEGFRMTKKDQKKFVL